MYPPNLYDVLSELNTNTKNFNNNHDDNLSADHTNITDLLSKIETNTENHIHHAMTNNNDNENNTNNGTEPFTLNEFNKFLTRTHCDENMKFFIMARPFLMQDDKKSMFSAQSSISTNSFEINFNLDGWNDTIYNIFIKVDSPLECNFPQRIRNLFDNCYQSNKPPRQAYIAQAIQHILNLLFDAYSKFLKYQLDIIEKEKEKQEKLRRDTFSKDELLNEHDTTLSKSLSTSTSSNSSSPSPKIRNTNKISSKQSKKVRNDNKKLYSVKSKSTSRGNSTIRRNGTESTSPPPCITSHTTTSSKNMNILSKGSKFLNKFKKSYF